MSLDLFQNDAQAAYNNASERIASDLPVGFSEGLSTSWRYMTDWHSSVAYQASKAEALAEYGDDVFQRTGVRLPTTAYGEGLISTDGFNRSIQKLNDQYPVNLSPMTEDDADRMALQRMARAKRAGDALGEREKTWGGVFGSAAGTVAGALADPVQALLLPLGASAELGAVRTALEFGAIGAGSEGAVAALSAGERQRAVPGSTKEIPGEIAAAGASGLVLGGAFGFLGKLLRAGEVKLPTAARDDINVATSEAQFNATNVFPTVEGEVAGHDAVVQTLRQAVSGEPVTAADGFNPAHARAFADSVGASTPEEAAEAGERALRPLTFGEKPDVERFDPLPAVSGAGGETLAGGSLKPFEGISRIEPGDLTSAKTTALVDSPEAFDAVQRNLDRIRVAQPDADFSFQVRQADGSYQFVTRKLEDVLDEIDGMHQAGQQLLECATGMMVAG